MATTETRADGVIYRLRLSHLITGAVCTIFFTAAMILSVVVAWFNADGSFAQPLLSAVGLGLFWGCFVLLGLWLVAASLRGRLILSSTTIYSRGVWRMKELPLTDISEVCWRPIPRGGRIIFRSPSAVLSAHMHDFENSDQQELIAFARKLLPESRQTGWPAFVASRGPRGQNKRRRWITVVHACLFLGFGVVFTYAWTMGLGRQHLGLGIANLLAGIVQLWLIAKLSQKAGTRPSVVG